MAALSIPGTQMDDEPLIRKQAPWMVGLALAGMALLFLQWFSAAHNSMETISYSKFEELTGQGAVTDVIVGKDTIEGNRHWRTVQSLPQVRLDKWSRGLERGQRRSSG
jgi:hypothetical protein